MTAPSSPPRRKRLVRWGLTVVVLSLVAVLFWRALADNWAEVQAQQLQFSWLMVAAVVLFAVAVPVSGLLWGAIVNRLSPATTVTPREAMAVHSASWLLKYVPGQVGSLLNKVIWGKKQGISRSVIVISFIYENVFLQVSSIVPSAAILLVSVGLVIFQDNPVTVLLPILALIPLLMVLDRRLFHPVLNFGAKRILKQELPREYFLPPAAVGGYLVGFVAPRIINGVGFVLVASSFLDLEPSAWLPLAATYVLAGAIGILAVFVPSGLGVREAVIFVFALQYMTPAQAVILSLLARLLSTVADAVVALLYGVLTLWLKRQPPKLSRDA
ncbi:lysylphosphatidylglycerol synthase domain-containing protein [Salinibacterium sp. SWN1162]|uniref:lysylphosphatidylglycerol synthase domain-containing protein n=1 Tax=Salinibacterium sp. SWN1162 TaxID=2792053 RepID=UPI0018CF04E5|nr:lysylphosphatidylglycerol synthase domain-containing protein [Salinibacterium sp. SWN1162]MBH0009723.1 flippase-like domain-containing protein [Salinibacterium sp. SWN1162]